MTQDEFDRLPDVTPSFGQRVEIIDGKRWVFPVEAGLTGALYAGEPGDGIRTDANGDDWLVGRMSNGVRARKRV
jgi:hypothetical protein